MRTIAQWEHRDCYSDPLPAADTIERMEDLVRARRSAILAYENNRLWVETVSDERKPPFINRMTAAARRRREIEEQIVEVARLIVAEAANAEMVTA